MSNECENYVEDYTECLRGGNYHQDDCSYCSVTGEPCASDDEWSICPKGEDD